MRDFARHNMSLCFVFVVLGGVRSVRDDLFWGRISLAKPFGGLFSGQTHIHLLWEMHDFERQFANPPIHKRAQDALSCFPRRGKGERSVGERRRIEETNLMTYLSSVAILLGSPLKWNWGRELAIGIPFMIPFPLRGEDWKDGLGATEPALGCSLRIEPCA